MSFAQEELRRAHLLDPESPAYNVHFSLALDHAATDTALIAALRALSMRHEILRTTFPDRTGDTGQLVHDDLPLEVRVEDLRAWDAAARPRAFDEIARVAARTPFDIAHGPLLRAVRVRVDEQHDVLLVTMHHLTTDGWSVGVFVRELRELLRAEAEGRAPVLTPLAVQYADFAAWQRAQLSDERLREASAFWAAYLADVVPLDLTTDRRRPALPSYEGAAESLLVDAELAARVRQASRAGGITLFTTLLTAFNVMLRAHSTQGDLVVGVPVANRDRAEVQPLIGLFVNMVAVRTTLDGQDTFLDLARRVQASASEAFGHQDIPFDALRSSLAVKRDPSRNAVFQTVFSLLDEGATLAGTGSSSATAMTGPQQTTRFDLEAHVLDGADGLRITFVYRTDLFADSTVRRWLARYRHLLTSIVDDPNARVREISFLEPGERQQVLHGWNDTRRPFAADRSIPGLFEQQVESRPDAVAVEDADARLTYRQLDERANQVAHALRAAGVGLDDRVGVCLERGVDLIVSVLGIVKAGGAYVALSPADPPARSSALVADAGVQVVVTGRAALSSEVAVRRLDVATTVTEPVTRTGVHVPAEALAYVSFTSGSTGRPKGVAVPQRAVARLVSSANYVSLGPAETLLQLAPVNFDASTLEIWGALLCGGRLVVAPPGIPTPGELSELLVRTGVTTMWLTASLYNAVVDERVEALSSVRQLLIGGEALSVPHVRRGLDALPATTIINGYGPTENTTFSCCHEITRDVAADAPSIPIGAPITNTQVYVLDDAGEPVGVGVPGELFAGGAGLARGYLGSPRQTAERFVPDGVSGESGARLYRTGDTVRWTGAGLLDFVGRRDGQIKLRGYRIELGEVTAALRAVPGVGAAAVVLQTVGARRLVAYVSAAPGSRVDADRLRASLQATLPAYMVPSAISVLAQLPLTASGKIDIQSLPVPSDADQGIEDRVAPRTHAERTLARIWSDVLRHPEVGVHDNFFDLGGDSILSLQIVSRAIEAGLSLKPRHLFQHPTVAELAGVAEAAVARVDGHDAVVGDVRLTPIQRWFFDAEPADPHHFNQSMFLRVTADTDLSILARAIEHLAVHHDMLRAYYQQTPAGWTQAIAPAAAQQVCSHVDLSSVPAGELSAEIERACAEVQAGFDLARGPLFRGLILDLGSAGPARLLLVAHHLVVDGVSWRILADDLRQAYNQLSKGTPLSLPAKTTSFQAWADALSGWAERAPEPDTAFWLHAVRKDGPQSRVPGTVDARVRTSLGRAETTVLLQDAPRALDARITELLLAALGEAFRATEATGRLRVDLESHGRQDFLPGVDVSRTVGWFTAIYPVDLDLGEAEPALDVVKRALREIPHDGIGYGALRHIGPEAIRAALSMSDPPVAFNYLGQFDQLFPDGDRFAVASEGSGPPTSPRQARRHDLDVIAFVHDGQMRVEWVYDDTRRDHQSMEALAARYLDIVRGYVERARRAVSRPGLVEAIVDPQARSAHAGLLDPTDLDPAQAARLRASYPDVLDAFAVTPMQHGMLFHTLLHPDDGVYTEVFTCCLEGTMEVETFQRAWGTLIERHDVLRSVFAHQGVAVPVQVVLRVLEPPWTVLDWSTLQAEEQADRVAALVAVEERTGFDVASGPLMRFTLARLGERHTQFIWSFHHALLDGWSLAVALGELGEIYEAALEGLEHRLPPARPYREYVRWLRSQDDQAAVAFWTQSLRDAATPTPLGIDRRAHFGDSTPDSREHTVQFSAGTSVALAHAARAQKVTTNAFLLGAWAVLLSRFSGRVDVVFGMTVAGRPADLAGSASRLGLFINTVPTRVHVPSRGTIADFVRQVQTSQLDQRDHEHLPLVEIARCAGAEADSSLFESILVFENYPIERAGAGPRRVLVASEAEGRHRSNYPLVLVGSPGDRLTMRAIYDARRFDEGVIERLLERFERVVAAMVANVHQPVEEMHLAAPEETAAVVSRWNATTRACPSASIPALFEAQAAARPDAVAVSAVDEQLTYGALDARSNTFAQALRRAGVGLDDRVGVCLDRGVDLVVTLLAILKAGAAYVAVDPSEPEARLAGQLVDAGVRVVVGPHTGLPSLARFRVLCVRDAAAEPETRVAIDVPQDALAYVAFTSGSTGRPKGVEVTHRGVVRLLFDQQYIALGPEESILQLAPVSFDASTLELWGALLHGGRLVCYPGRVPEPSELGRFLHESGVTTAWLTASLYNTVIDRAPQALRGVRQLLIGGEALSVPHVRKGLDALPTTTIVNGYGPTENTTFTCCFRIPADLSDRAASVPLGGPITNTQTYVLDAVGQPAPVDVPGELFIGGAGLARGYAGAPRLTAERFVPDATSGARGARLYRTGDVVRWRTDGTLDFLGRRDDQIKLRGFRIELGEVESALAGTADVASAVAAIHGAGEARRLVGYVVPAAGTVVDGSQVRLSLQRALPAYMVPSSVVVLDRLPLTANGKVDRRALPDPEDSGASRAFTTPRTPIEARVANVWADVLGVARVGAFDNFFDRGGHSLLATQVVSRLREEFSVALPLVALFDAPTVAELAALLGANAAGTNGQHYPAIPNAPRDGELPLSPAQQRLWFLDRLNPGSSAYNVPAALRIQGDLDLAALEGALGEIVRRHEVLRTVFAEVDGRARQEVQPWTPFVVSRVDLKARLSEEQDAAVAALAAAEARTPFDLSRAPLVRATVIGLGPRRHVLLLTLHHVACDAWSLTSLVRELMAFYRNGGRAAGADVPVLSVQFADFARWQRTLMQGDGWQSQLDYWTTVLADVSPMELPTDRPRPAVQTFNGSHVTHGLAADASTALRDLGQAEGATYFMVMLAAFNLLLSRHTGQRDLAVGTPIAYRPRPELEPLIGFFSNTLVVRSRTAACVTFRDWVGVVRDSVHGALAHQDVPFEQVVEAVQPARRLDRNPLFQVLFTLHHAAVDPLELPGLTIEPLDIERMSVRLDLEVHVGEGRDGPVSAFYFNTDLFDADTIARMAAAYSTLVARVAAEPDRPLSEIDLRSDEEIANVGRWNDTTRPIEWSPVHRFVERQVRRTPDATAVEFGGARLTYAELNGRANQLARALRAAGVRSDDRVAVAVERSLDMPVCILGVMKAGAAYLPLDLAYPKDRLSYMLEDSGARILLTQNAVAKALPLASGSEAMTTVVVDRDWAAVATHDEADGEWAVDPENLAYVLYTSGSTGRPKGVALAHRALVNLLEWQLEVSGAGAAGRTVQYAPLSFDPSFLEMFSAWSAGGTLVLLEEDLRRDFLALVRHLDRERIERIYITPAALHQLADASENLDVVPRSLREINAAGERLEITPQIARMCARIPGCVVFNQYGPTESHVVTADRLAGAVTGWPSQPSIGVALPNTQMHVLDGAWLPVPVGVPSELFIAGECLARGYLNKPRLTAERFLPDPWSRHHGARMYRTGDLTRQRADGAVEYLGRTDHQVKLRGYRIELGEVESVLTQHPGVLNAVAAVRETASGSRILVAYVVRRGERMPAAEDLRAHVAAALPEYMVPSLVQEMASVPLTPSGKVDRGSLPALDGDTWQADSFVEPRTPFETLVAGMWAEGLGVLRVGVHDNFFAMGGHSLLAAQVVSRARREWGVEVPIRLLFEQPTVAAFADHVQTLVWASRGQALAGASADREEGEL